jgi:hypothetical protein
MNAEQYCAEYGKELLSGRITFSKKVTDKFIKTYTYLDVTDFTPEMYKRLRMYMIDLCTSGYSKMVYRGADLPIEKIELSNFILCIPN